MPRSVPQEARPRRRRPEEAPRLHPPARRRAAGASGPRRGALGGVQQHGHVPQGHRRLLYINALVGHACLRKASRCDAAGAWCSSRFAVQRGGGRALFLPAVMVWACACGTCCGSPPPPPLGSRPRPGPILCSSPPGRATVNCPRCPPVGHFGLALERTRFNRARRRREDRTPQQYAHRREQRGQRKTAGRDKNE